MKTFIQSLKISFVLLIICGILYPLGMTGISQLIFHKQANGSIIEYNKKAVGSELLGQNFTDNRYFHGRVSAYKYNSYTNADTIPDKNGKTAYSGVSSGSENLAPSNPKLVARVKVDIDEFIMSNPSAVSGNIPADILTSSGSGLDPHISPDSAKLQLLRISNFTGISLKELEIIIENCTEHRVIGIFGTPRLNVLKANIEISKKLAIM